MAKAEFPIRNAQKAIRRLMEEKGDKPKPLAQKLGLGETAIRDMLAEGAKGISTRSLNVICAHYGVAIGDILDGTATTERREEREDVRHIPLLGDVPAGPWREALTKSRRSIPTPISDTPKSAYALKVKGDSMDKLANDGDTIVIDPEDLDLFDKRLFVVRNGDGEVTFKQYREGPARLVPCSKNPEHQVIPITSSDFTIVGRVVLIVTRPDQAALD
ncbi:hypothetical protein GCM10007897_43700 [Sphingobium jiangsuense]|uniref:SOS-response transcriptional repressor LexA n=2 Tax=Sphingobium jiangsuense TaxID=870476 RepID=A0A7W6BNB2_9SPHN|nr:SOS-response transcriptional repressor LexA [Sphingobium jiangsuense]GLT02940.1 hypothetical protein GCM10007897_43700 [Sphingobium jiangsuense]